jgi:hypothetical protein
LGTLLILVGLFGLCVSLVTLIKGSIRTLGVSRRKQGLTILGLSLVALFLGGAISPPTTSVTSPPETPSFSPSPELQAQLVAYFQTNVPAALPDISGFDTSRGESQVLISTRYDPVAERLPFAQSICEHARLVARSVSVEAKDGTDLWICDAGSSVESPQVAALLASKAQEAQRLADEAAAKQAAAEAAKRAADEAARNKAAADAATQRKTQNPVISNPPVTGGGICSADYYRNVDGNCVHRPDSSPAGASAKCADGTYSYSQHRQGTCSHHGGVAQWL